MHPKIQQRIQGSHNQQLLKKKLEFLFEIVFLCILGFFIVSYTYKFFTYDKVESTLSHYEEYRSDGTLLYRPIYSYDYRNQTYEFQSPEASSEQSAVSPLTLLVQQSSPYSPTPYSVSYMLSYLAVALAIAFSVALVLTAIYYMRNEPPSLNPEDKTSGVSAVSLIKNFLRKQPMFYLIVGAVILFELLMLSEYVGNLSANDVVIGTVTRHEESTNATGTILYRPIYSYQYDETTYEFVSPRAGSRGANPTEEIGSLEKLFVDPDDPTDAAFASPLNLMMKMLIVLIIGIIVLGIYYLHPLAILYSVISIFIIKIIKVLGLKK